ncbi:LOW QUALITY PROTEIN: testis-expressed protein 54 [Capricornis sumatraensis]|uniref:LOW QUALITY PROTEIN: testis-expressed protein 54 n=1 Tax=Capricornis sumatraensis TaxID=34865 RepID=UPI00360487C7
MGCCQDKDFQTSDEQAKEAGSAGGTGDTPGGPGSWEWGLDHQEVGLGILELSSLASSGTDADSVEQRDRRSNESLLITVLWRRLSMFSRRGSARSTKRQAVQNPKPASRIQECDQERIQEEPEKG